MTAASTTNSSARESILASIRQNLAESRSFDRVHSQHQSSIDSLPTQMRSTLTREELIHNFKRNLESVGGHCHVVTEEKPLPALLRALIDNLGATKIAISDSELVISTADGLPEVEFVKNADSDFLFSSDVGITSAQLAIAETGTLVLESDAESHRLTSLIPPVHICILQTSKIRQTLNEVLDSIDTERSRTVTFITGASRTSDIELTLAIGVHGPRELHVILIADHRS